MHFLPILANIGLSLACVRLTWTNPNNNHKVVTGRSVDVLTNDTELFLYFFPRGISRTGGVKGQNYTPLNWTSIYASTATVLHNDMFIEGVNEQGLSASALIKEEDGELGSKKMGEPALSSSIWMQYYLDTFGSVSEIFKTMCNPRPRPVAHSHVGRVKAEEEADVFRDWAEHRIDKIQVIANPRDIDGISTAVVLGISDIHGDTLIMEHKHDKLNCFHAKNHDKYAIAVNDIFTRKRAKGAVKTLEEVLNRNDNIQPQSYRKYLELSNIYSNRKSADTRSSAMFDAMHMLRQVTTSESKTKSFELPKVKTSDFLWPTKWRIVTDLSSGYVVFENPHRNDNFHYRLDDFDKTTNGRTMLLTVDHSSSFTEDVSKLFKQLGPDDDLPFSNSGQPDYASEHE
ncbi:penicillin acylase [Fusarium beomiforme]|uniref:Penicillin acylase n=1 Tax=Fusarium beomiforme TaxID=44412 RepID=A0A9P5DWL2_9HYPO|nr:penicillin acylase [Fusarium beomiforme]